MAQYVFSMNRLGKIVPPKKFILKDISLSFFPGAKIGVLGTNGSGKSTLLKIMAGVDKEFEGEAMPMAGLNIGYLPQEPQLDPDQTVRESVEAGMGDVFMAKARLEEIYAAYGEEDADFDALAEEQAKMEAIIGTAGSDTEHQLEIAADALRLPPWDAKVGLLSGGEKALTAIALVFAIFQLNPAPFCLLDEVDAPLDDANTERYAKLVSSMSKGTQFLFISHNKIAMEMAEQLIGVTMQEQGVSRIVAVDMDAAVSMVESA